MQRTPHTDRSELELSVDRSSTTPLYRQLTQQLEVAIRSGRIGAGEAIGNVTALAQRHGVARQTMRQAILELVDKGLLVRRRSIGTHVVDQPPARTSTLTSLFDDLTAAGRRPTSVLLNCTITPAPVHVTDALGLPRDEPLLRLLRLRLADRQPLAIMENYLPADLFDPSTVDLAARGLYEALRGNGVTLQRARQRIGARAGTRTECQLLQEPPNSVLLTIGRVSHDRTSRAVEYANHLFPADRYQYAVTLVSG